MKEFEVNYRKEIHKVQVDDADAKRIEEAWATAPHNMRQRKLSYVPAWKNRGFRPALFVGGKLQYLSRWILGVTDSTVIVDHIDQNPLNNCRSNLRAIDKRLNSYNSGKMGWERVGKTSKYRGVCWSKSMKKWAAHITVDRKQLSRYSDTEIGAAILRDQLVLEYLGSGVTTLNVLLEEYLR